MSDNILSLRLRLVPLTPDALEGMLEGDGSTAAVLLGVDPPAEWMEGQRFVFALRRDQMRRDPSEQPWLLRGIVSREVPPVAIGQIGFHEPPGADGFVEKHSALESQSATTRRPAGRDRGNDRRSCRPAVPRDAE